MFEKRKVHSFRYSDALTLLKEDENRLKILIEKEIIHPNGNFVELDARFLDFFELLLEANEERSSRARKVMYAISRLPFRNWHV